MNPLQEKISNDNGFERLLSAAINQSSPDFSQNRANLA